VFEDKCDKLYAGKFSPKWGKIDTNRNVLVLLLH